MELDPRWRKSSYSANGNNCVEAGSTPGSVLIRDTKDDGHGPILKASPADWRRFTRSVKG
ncbi:MAG TPA: DUF397 domain-containing protein [Trebonia sp.]|jgi:hypothetical protein|nr:DUF397 domain-containing protein [Trebonia sp.]